jgi:hypothetical protein
MLNSPWTTHLPTRTFENSCTGAVVEGPRRNPAEGREIRQVGSTPYLGEFFSPCLNGADVRPRAEASRKSRGGLMECFFSMGSAWATMYKVMKIDKNPTRRQTLHAMYMQHVAEVVVAGAVSVGSS